MTRRRGIATVALATLVAGSGCLQQAAPAPYEERDGAPPWPAPRDGISAIQKAGLAELPLNDRTDPWIVHLTIAIDGKPVEVVRHIGMDRPRAIQAAVHTHDNTGQVWLEGEGNRTVTLAQFFTVWGVRFTEKCLGAACGGVTVLVDGREQSPPWDQLVMRGARTIDVQARTR